MNPIDPKIYLEEKMQSETPAREPEVKSVRQATVTIEGRPYYKFSFGKASILLPKVTHLTDAELERAVCSEDVQTVCDPNKVANDLDPEARARCDAEGLRDALVTRAQLEVSPDVVVYIGAIEQTIQKTCGGGGMTPNAKKIQAALVELGIERRSSDPRHPGSQKMFLRPLQQQIGVGTSF